MMVKYWPSASQFVAAASLAVFLVLSYIIWSPVGTVLAAIRDNDQRTAFFGYDIVRYKVGAFVVSALVSGLAGALFVKQFGFAAPSLIGFGLSTEVLIWVAVGGATCSSRHSSARCSSVRSKASSPTGLGITGSWHLGCYSS